jgi:hypothetical protein
MYDLPVMSWTFHNIRCAKLIISVVRAKADVGRAPRDVSL